MTSRTSRVLITTVAALLAATSLGCGLLEQAKNVVGTAQILADFSDRLGRAATLTYTAEYKLPEGKTVTLVQEPPNAAFITKAGRYIVTSEFWYFCESTKGAWTCQKSPNQASGAGAAEAGLVTGVAGPGFVTPELAIGFIAAAALVPGAKVSESEKTIAGQQSLCVEATGLDAGASPGDTDAPRDFSVCVTEAGILGSFSGTSTSGEKLAVELASYSESADAGMFEPPSGAKIVDVSTIDPGK